LLNALLLVAGQLVSIIALVTRPLGNFSILVGCPCGCAAGDDVLVVWAWDSGHSRQDGKEAGKSQNNSSGESHVQNTFETGYLCIKSDQLMIQTLFVVKPEERSPQRVRRGDTTRPTQSLHIRVSHLKVCVETKSL